MTINPAVPADDDIVSQYPAAERSMRTALRNEHDANGRHIQVSFTNRVGSPPAGLADHVTMWQEDGVLFQRVGTDAATPLGVAPVGGIIMWSGTLASIPSGWALCDGTNGTPDLRDKFVKGAAAAADPGTTGGASTHDHGGATANHVLTGAQIPSHNHGIGPYTFVSGDSPGGTHPGPAWGGDNIQAGSMSAVTGFFGSNQAHAHGIGAANHEPPFFAIAYIMFTG